MCDKAVEVMVQICKVDTVSEELLGDVLADKSKAFYRSITLSDVYCRVVRQIVLPHLVQPQYTFTQFCKLFDAAKAILSLDMSAKLLDLCVKYAEQ